MLKTGLSGLILGATCLAAILTAFLPYARKNVVFFRGNYGPAFDRYFSLCELQIPRFRAGSWASGVAGFERGFPAGKIAYQPPIMYAVG